MRKNKKKGVIRDLGTSRYQKMKREVKAHILREERTNRRLQGSFAYKMVNAGKKYDDWFLDPILGMISPTVGDVVSALAVLPALYVAVFKIKSFKLAVAIAFVTVIDVLCGLIPGVGDVVDALHKSNKKAGRWIAGYLEDDEKTRREVNRHFWVLGGIIIIIVLIVALFFTAIVNLMLWLGSFIW